MIDPVAEAAAAPLREGMPYWIFWFLVSLIVLLLFFILLRDKDLRGRLSLRLAGTKKRVLKKSLLLRLSREKRRKTYLRREVGRTAWGVRMDPGRFGPEFNRLVLIERKIAARHSVLQDLNDEIVRAKAEAEGPRKRRRVRDLERKSRAERRRLRAFGREKSRQYEALGARVDELRLAHPDLAEFYARIDKVNRSILAVQDRVEKLG